MKTPSKSGGSPHAQDPVRCNPAPPGHPAHETWEVATREAEQKLLRFQAEILAERPASGEDHVTWVVRLHMGTFQIWAERGLCLVRSFEVARAYEEWLERYRGAYLKSVEDSHSDDTFRGSILLELSRELLRCVKYWTANAIDQAADIQASSKPEKSNDDRNVESKASSSGQHDADPSKRGGKRTNPTDASAVSAAATRGADRRAVVEPILKQKGYTRSKWATRAGVDPCVVYDYVNGTSNPTPESRNALAGALGLSVDELPR